ncbi:MAG: hypothetical protein WD648_05670 [Planctomycetaceae bacterium]
MYGEVYIDGQPAWHVQVDLTPKGGPDASNPTSSYGESGQDGRFAIMTYSTSDGAPPGEYILTFQWYDRTKQPQAIRAAAEGETGDQLDGMYADPNNSRYTITIDADATEVDVGRIHLKTQQRG